MREILFRGKRIDNGEWAFGSLHSEYGETDKDGNRSIDYRILGMRGECTYVMPETVGQYTGLPDNTDKNGKKIFEGDMFRMDEDDLAVVIFKDGCFRLEVHGICGAWTESGFDECGGGYGIIGCDPIDWYYIHDMEVIGNIHDNPELLEEG